VGAAFGCVESGVTAGVTVFLGVGFGFAGVAAAPVALAGVAVGCPTLDGFFASALLFGVELTVGVPVARGFAWPLLMAGFC